MKVLSILLALSLGLLTLEQSLVPIVGGETDFWWHLQAGQRLWSGHFDLLDPYSFVYTDKRWIHIDWAFQALIYPVYAAGGPGGVLVLRALIQLAAAALLWRLLDRCKVAAGARWLICLATVSVWGSGIALRPATVSIAFTVGVQLLLEEVRRGNRRWLSLLPPLICLWFNLHVAALAGCLLVGVYAVGVWLEGDRQHWKAWALCLLGCAIAPFLNPQGWRTVYLPLEFLWTDSPWNQIILEVQAPEWHWPGTATARLLTFLAALEAVWGLRQRRWATLLVVVVFGYLSWSNYRHQFQFCSILACFAGCALARLRWPHLLTRWMAGALSVLALAVALRALLYLGLAAWPPGGLLRRESFAESVVQALAEASPGLRVFTDMNSAGYYIWRTSGGQPIFLDSRSSQVFDDPQLVGAYFEILLDRPRAQQLLDHFNIEVVAENRLASGNSSLYSRLSQHPDWVRLYSDSTGSLLCRRSLQSRLPIPRMPRYLQLYESARRYQLLGDGQRANERYLECLQHYPQFANARLELARLALARGQNSWARQQLALAELYNPAVHSPDLWRQLGIRPATGSVLAWLLPFLALPW